MLTVARRALVVGLLGPAIQAIGFLWTAVHLLVSHWSEPFGPRHLMYEPGVLLIVVGFLASLVCIPVAMELTRAQEEDAQIPVYEKLEEDGANRVGLREAGGRLARYSAGRSRPATDQDQ